MKQQKQIAGARDSRRGFIKTLAVAGGAAAVAPASVAVAAKPAAGAPAPVAAKGYQQTKHIRRYYSLAREV